MSSDEKSKRKKILSGNDMHYPGQTNHDACYVPECVRQYSREPLYILVAHWCLQQQNWVQRNQISEAFHITARRASYLIAYLRSKTSRVISVCRHHTLPNKARRYEIYVIRVLDSPIPSTRRKKAGPQPASKCRSGNGDRSMANELWNRLCSNRNAGKILKKKEDEDDGT
ncbi:CaiF/GrlA family transcriptional regulator [Salmonella enterica subsp. indica]|uniref:Positive regulator GrlA n=1 Tax=Salmonella enterica subsp. indica TaxID=59207 RepID=A0A379XL07_SALER|nr:CaiF/GrlA family transcriptional regulator [Salmonella enterica]EBP3213465.1 CaiF/GrlA family transcriptional regulator [Salmonella enterica subsp. arizonae]ECI8271341.1 CaiF/GrlA family transcriptional regulator [Salmonella enterica subsp. enterica]EDR2770659.1 CaiF/GrlA family transcriptional regulator [Salmonella enterica subsp. enterica serovar Oslo]EEC4251017.1 CaiF/GrlA family transcriptional regulator [Salmonella enterica subsp. diarizonae]ECC3877185.1 CaiF/GrlA family transcriptiona